MHSRTLRALTALVLGLSLLAVACGGSDPEAEATWETHTTAEDGTAGDESSEEAD